MICPKCGNDDVAKVSDCYQMGKRVTTFQKPVSFDMQGKEIFLGTVPEKEYILSPLAQKLSPPPQPQYFGPILSSTQGIGLSVLRLIFTLGVFIFVWTLLIDPTIQIMSEFINVSISETRFLWLGIVLILLIVHMQLVVDIKQVRITLKKMKDWELSILKWKSLYYCGGCNCTFSPSSED